MKKFSYLLLILFSFIYIINAEEIELNSEKYILYNLDYDLVLLEKDKDLKTSIASLTKIMTVLLAIENNSDYSKEIVIEKNMIKDIAWDVAVTGFKVGDKVTIDDLLYSAILVSGADSVNALAYTTSGNLEDFVKLMNEKAKELKMNNTHFTNAIGLYDINHYSSAEDILILLKYALKNEKFKEVWETQKYNMSNNKEIKGTIVKYNNSKNDISYITGAKTGYLSKAGNCLATTSFLGNTHYILITLNSFKGTTSHIEDAVKVYNYFGNKYENKNILQEDDVMVTLKTNCAKEKQIDIYSNTNINKYLEKEINKEDIDYLYDGINEISYFTKKGTILGSVKLMYNDNELDKFDLIYNETLTFSLLAFIVYYKYIFIVILLVIILSILKIKKHVKK